MADTSSGKAPVDNERQVALARAIGLAEGHTFADLSTMAPGSNTMLIAHKVLAYLAANDYYLMQMSLVPITKEPTDER